MGKKDDRIIELLLQVGELTDELAEVKRWKLDAEEELRASKATIDKKNERIEKLEASLKAMEIPDPDAPQTLDINKTFTLLENGKSRGVYMVDYIRTEYSMDSYTLFPNTRIEIEAYKV